MIMVAAIYCRRTGATSDFKGLTYRRYLASLASVRRNEKPLQLILCA